MTRWGPRVLAQLHDLLHAGRVKFTYKALRELASLDLSLDDANDILHSLSPDDIDCRLRSDVTQEWMYIFRPSAPDGSPLYVKVIIRSDCVVISFHERHPDDEE